MYVWWYTEFICVHTSWAKQDEKSITITLSALGQTVGQSVYTVQHEKLVTYESRSINLINSKRKKSAGLESIKSVL